MLELRDDIAELQSLALQLEIAELEDSFVAFIPAAWLIVEPSPFVPNWHVDAIAEHLEAVSNGYIKDLLVTMPPRHSKSLVLAVLWADWEWTRKPQNRWIFNSYSFNLSVRDSIKRRSLIKSQWYQDRWGDKFHLMKEQDSKIRYENDKRGFMLASSVGGSNTGEGGERIIADDPHNVKKVESEDVRLDTVNWWNVVMSTRRNDASAARVVVQQRVHEGDVAGDIIERGGYVHLDLPAEFVPTRRCFTSWTETTPSGISYQRTWADPRKEEGELLNPIRFNRQAIEKAKIELGDYQFAAQFQQDPTPPKGSIIQAQWLKYYGGPTGVPIPDFTRCTNALMPLLSLDCTFKDHKDTDYVAGLAWAQFGADIYLMPLNIHERASFTGTINAVAKFVGGKNLDGETFSGVYPFLKIKLVEDKANGSAIIDTMRHQIPGMIAYEPGNASKTSRLEACSWRFRAGNIFLPHESIAPWIKEYVYELCAFPKAKRDDYADATSQALLWIGGEGNVTGTPLMSDHESRWIGIQGDSTAAISPWGNFMGTRGGSRWKQ